jgi:4-amino-4-deoxy-L-arabinose transferase-like glycosyltransferase
VTVRQVVAEPVATAGSGPLSPASRLRSTIVARWDFVVLLVVYVFGVAYESYFLFRGWFPWDEGALAESASRVLAGQLPHRDFGEIYSGGLSYLHAFAFLLFGEKLASMRVVLFAFFAVWIPVLYAVGRRFASPAVAGAFVAACIAWSVPNYSASMPSWYNLFFATFALECLLRYFDKRRARWLVAAGLACGLSVIVKSTGIYAVVALFLVLLFDEQVRAESKTVERRRSYLAFVLACSGAAVAFLVVLLHRRLGASEAANFLVPGSCIAAFLIWNEVRVRRAPASARFHSLLGPVGSFGLGLALPLVFFVSPYVYSNSLGSLLHGLIVEPSARLRFAAITPPTLSSIPITILLVVAFAGLAYALSRHKLGERVAGAGLLAIWFVLTGTSYGYKTTWVAVRDASILLVPIGVALLAAVIRRRGSDPTENVRRFAPLALFAFATLIQFPFSAPIYFCYVAPLVFLAALALAPYRREAGGASLPSTALVALFLFLAAFGVVRMNPVFFGGRATMGEGAPLGLARSGPLRVFSPDSRLYRRVVARIREAGTNRYIYAGPDAPELYFLADRQNPTRTTFEFFERGSTQDAELLRALDRHGVSVVALNLRPPFSPRLDSTLMAALAARYPHHERIGHFELRWRT